MNPSRKMICPHQQQKKLNLRSRKKMVNLCTISKQLNPFCVSSFSTFAKLFCLHHFIIKIRKKCCLTIICLSLYRSYKNFHLLHKINVQSMQYLAALIVIGIKTKIRFNKCQGIDFVTDAKTTEGERGSSAQKTQKSEGDKTSVSAFGSITAQLMDGMTLALSQFGATGESKDGKPSILVILYLQEALIL